MMNFKNIFRRHLLVFLLLFVASGQTLAATKLLILGDSLSAGYRLPAEQAWASLLAERWQKLSPPIAVVNGSISGNTSAQGLERLPALLEQHKPDWVLIELGANDGLQGLSVEQMENTLQQIIQQITQTGAKPLLMQIRIPPNYGKRYTSSFEKVYSTLAEKNAIPLLPFYMEEIITRPEWIQQDGIHPTVEAQPTIADFMETQLKPYLVPSAK
ncbi:multifunctional acyl-CoA thioesterase I/protease I/lysophospholipase L1 [Providencia stuartii]|uniref:Multifunctional acyl-CoA thioesterase I/protease I/lysophospholipase L1 n=1 Tax=Providencia manganoxydans TaxID=2923283 RepID=A0ABX7AIW0_9GAMM|nr:MULTISPECIES: multifunctional acyl-CoA thioesterase I/protease I/lysophospholipase L1 [Providencia]MDV5226808.1 multifunctional acyl-CoA thioesterase I/protease I/lysophospholipase L1 [Providencia rettgeri]ELR5039199.1 multifunctional acyl-CoA thioesterase I/protease I/lysophospholipase L1 [Providencia stuartii]ELR5083708.1 multifunctional acyl-CoA thioesterase I/protease I/lysophospholipase L1 [Providencia stuartii]ELR5299627.1 multifunctional acyl-CoA thioesterase I/protease I/lysophosphol